MLTVLTLLSELTILTLPTALTVLTMLTIPPYLPCLAAAEGLVADRERALASAAEAAGGLRERAAERLCRLLGRDRLLLMTVQAWRRHTVARQREREVAAAAGRVTM